MESKRTKIMPNDTVLHKPSGETWVVCGVNHEQGKLIPWGYPFPTLANTEDCKILEAHYELEPQSAKAIDALQKRGLESFIDVRSAMLCGVI